MCLRTKPWKIKTSAVEVHGIHPRGGSAQSEERGPGVRTKPEEHLHSNTQVEEESSKETKK